MKSMKMLAVLIVISGYIAMAEESTEPFVQKTSEIYEGLISQKQPDIAKLTLFFRKMPKGGDIHHHYDGSMYAETYLEWVGRKGWYIDTCSFQIVKVRSDDEICKDLSIPELMQDSSLYRKVLQRWSTLDYPNGSTLSPDLHFFTTFGYFAPVFDAYMDEGLQIIKARALKENISYIESILSRPDVQGKDYFDANKAEAFDRALWNVKSQDAVDEILDSITSSLLNNTSFEESVSQFVAKVNKSHQGIDDEAFTMRYQTFALRLFTPVGVYTELLASYLAAHRSPYIVGVNIVGAENDTVALRDYTLHMQMYNYLERRYPNVHRSLHAGELTLGMVRPEALRFHVKQALEIAHAQRVGHGVDLPYEDDSIALLETLKKNGTVEINFASNAFTLGVKGKEHPYTLYADYGVPLVIATDDSGVLRNDLTSQYVWLAATYKPAYTQLKEYVYNSITYSFLQEKEKARIKKHLDNKFEMFEKEMSESGKRFLNYY